MAQQQNRQRILLLSLCILLTGGIAAEGLLIRKHLQQKPLSVILPSASHSSSQAERDPEQELLDAVKAGEYTTVNDLLRTFYEDDPVPETVTAALSARVSALEAAYQDENADAESIQTELRSIVMLPLPAVTEPAKSVLETIRLHEAARSIIVQAERYAANGDYPGAIENFARVPKKETDLYEQAQARLEECRALFRTQTAEAAGLAYSEGDYNTAVLTLSDALQILTDDEELTGLLDAILTAERTSLRRDLLLEAGTLYGKGDYSGAFSKLYDLPEPLTGDELLAAAAANYRQKYLRELPYTVNELLQDGDFSAAEACISETEILFPDAEAIPELRTLIAGYQPQKLSALEISDFSDFSAAESALTDVQGNVYDADGCLYCSYDGDASGRQSSSGTFITNGQYNRLTLTAAPLSGFDPARTVFLEICADGKKLEHYTFTAETGVLHIRLDISGAKKITIRVLPAGTDDLRNTAVLLADGTVSKV